MRHNQIVLTGGTNQVLWSLMKKCVWYRNMLRILESLFNPPSSHLINKISFFTAQIYLINVIVFLIKIFFVVSQFEINGELRIYSFVHCVRHISARTTEFVSLWIWNESEIYWKKKKWMFFDHCTFSSQLADGSGWSSFCFLFLNIACGCCFNRNWILKLPEK